MKIKFWALLSALLFVAACNPGEQKPSTPTNIPDPTQAISPTPAPTLNPTPTTINIWDSWCTPSENVPAGWSYLDNGRIKVGVNVDYGAAIGYFSAKESGNLLDIADNGRYVQQSFYGDYVGGNWGGSKWDFNPVQGGSSDGKLSRVIEFCNDGLTLYARTIPLDWGNTGETSSIMEEWITLKEDILEIRFRFEYQDAKAHHSFTQETPAVYVQRDLEYLTFYDGNSPWTGNQASRILPNRLETDGNQYIKFTESWLAFLNSNQWGIGIYKKGETKATCFLVGDIGDEGATSYFAFLDDRSLVKGMVHEYSIYAQIGTLDDMRKTFLMLHEQGK